MQSRCRHTSETPEKRNGNGVYINDVTLQFATQCIPVNVIRYERVLIYDSLNITVCLCPSKIIY